MSLQLPPCTLPSLNLLKGARVLLKLQLWGVLTFYIDWASFYSHTVSKIAALISVILENRGCNQMYTFRVSNLCVGLVSEAVAYLACCATSKFFSNFYVFFIAAFLLLAM